MSHNADDALRVIGRADGVLVFAVFGWSDKNRNSILAEQVNGRYLARRSAMSWAPPAASAPEAPVGGTV